MTVCELIDPEETPKNVIIRAVKIGQKNNIADKIRSYSEACGLLGVKPELSRLLPLPEIPEVKELPITMTKYTPDC